MAFESAVVEELAHVGAELQTADFCDAARVNDVVDQVIAAVVLVRGSG